MECPDRNVTNFRLVSFVEQKAEHSNSRRKHTCTQIVCPAKTAPCPGTPWGKAGNLICFGVMVGILLAWGSGTVRGRTLWGFGASDDPPPPPQVEKGPLIRSTGFFS